MRIQLRTWHKLADELGIPIQEELTETWDAAGDWQAECMAAMWAAALKDEIDEDRHNPLRLVGTGSFRGLASYETWADAVTEWVAREDYLAWEIPVGDNTVLALNPRQKLTQDVMYRELDPVRERREDPHPYELEMWWGTAYKTMAPFNPLDPVCQQWLAEAAKTDQFPKLTLIMVRGHNGDYVYSFANGLQIGRTSENDVYTIGLKG